MPESDITPISDAEIARMEGDARRLAGLRRQIGESWPVRPGPSSVFGKVATEFVGSTLVLTPEADVLALAAEVRRLRARLAEMEVVHA
jgi:hypothetical protein